MLVYSPMPEALDAIIIYYFFLSSLRGNNAEGAKSSAGLSHVSTSLKVIVAPK